MIESISLSINIVQTMHFNMMSNAKNWSASGSSPLEIPEESPA